MPLEAGTYAQDFLAATLDNDGDVVALSNVAVVSEFYQRVSEAVAWTMRAMGAFDMGTFLTSRSLPLESVTVMAEASSASEATRAVSLYVPVAGATRPYGTFIQEDHVFRDTAINKAAHVAVAYGKCIRKGIASIAAVPQRERVFGRNSNCCCA